MERLLLQKRQNAHGKRIKDSVGYSGIMHYNLRSALKVQSLYEMITDELMSQKIYGTKLVVFRKRVMDELVDNGVLSDMDVEHWMRYNKVT